MPYHLLLHFNPDAAAGKLAPKTLADGSVDHRDLGFIQNVVVDQVLAELVPVSEAEAATLDPRFVLAKAAFPLGPNCKVDPATPTQLLSEVNGCAAFEDGVITVHKVLHVRRDVGAHTGNLLFVGDMVVHGAVRSGFHIRARNLLVKGVVGGARLETQESIVAEAGVKGGEKAVLRAGRSVKAAFCENARVLAGESMLVEGSCMHCDIYVGKQLVVRGRLAGGTLSCHRMVYVGGQLGGGAGTPTVITLGHDPFLLRESEKINETIEELEGSIEEYSAQTNLGEAHREAMAPKTAQAQKKIQALQRKLVTLQERIEATKDLSNCVLAVTGEVRPGVVVHIGDTMFEVNDYLNDVRFSLSGEQIVVTSPAMRK